ncbi:MAG: hypothetical protein IJJ58_01935, partial [Campylobacter sp.]|nr:hypothetical protein [Campylobacter sp.]
MYGVNTEEDIKIVKKAGFNCFQTYKQEFDTLKTLAEVAKKQDINAVFYPNKITSEEQIKEANTWPMLAWYIYDEPDVQRLDPTKVKNTNNEVKNKLKNAPTALVIGQGKTRLNYYNIADILMVDWYPVPHLNLNSFGKQLALAKAKLEPKTDFWGVVQAFNWKDYKQYRKDNDRIGRFPTEEEINFMSWHGIVNGANGLFYFAFNTGGKKLNEYSPEVWQALRNTLKEIKKFSYFMDKGKAINPPFTLPKILENRTWYYKNYYYTLIVNTSDKNLTMTLPNKAKI